MNYEIGNPNLIWLMLAIPVILALIVYSGWANRRAIASFGSASKPTNLIGESLAGLMLMLGMALLVLACMDIRWGKTSREVPQKGLEVVFALDVSRSMLAQDAKPNRLTRAKQQISDMVDEMAGDRIGLVAFAGEAIQVVPLTNHYNDFRQKLETLGPDAVSRGGSQLGVAIAEAADTFISKTNEHKTIILFTDGEDQESNPIELAREMHAKNGTRVFTVGLGDITQGARIPDGTTRRSEFVEHEGQQVWSKLNGSILREIATETKAAYIPAGTKRVNMADVYHSYVANVEKSEFETARINAFVPRFQWFAFPAFVCLFLNLWLTTRRSSAKPTAASSSANRTRVGTSTKVASRAAVVFIALMPGVLSAQTSDGSTASTINAANQLVRENKLQEAIESLNQIDDSPDSKHRDELNYSLATAHFRNADLDSAATLFEQSAKSTNTKIASDSRYNLGNCHYSKALPLAEQQPDAAIVELETAITHYRSALRLDRQRSDARENLERASKLIKQLKNQQENNQQQEKPQDQNSNEEQQQNQDQKDQSNQDQSEQQQNDSQGDQDQQSESDSNSNEQEKSGEGQNEDSENSDSSQQSEGDPGEQGESEQNQSSGDPNESTDPNSQQQSQSAESQSGKDGEQKEDGDTQNQGEQSAEDKQPPEGELSAANQSEDKTDDASAAKGKAARIGNDESGLMTKQEALKLLQAVRDRDMIRRLKQQQQRRQRRVRVDRDW